MASVSTDASGRKRVQFTDRHGERQVLSLGGMADHEARVIAGHVAAIVAAQKDGDPPPRKTRDWLDGLAEGLRDKLARVGLAEPLGRLTVAEFLAAWLDGKRAGGFAANSIRTWAQTAAELAALLGTRRVATLAHADGEAYRAGLLARKLRPTTVHKRLGHARQMMADAVRLGHVEANPFGHVRQRQGDPAERRRYVTAAETAAVLDACPDAWWRLLVALARHAGLRTPSEPFALTWDLVDWHRGRLVVPGQKTAARTVPIFPSLLPHLEAAYDLAEDGAVHVFPDAMRRRTNLRQGLARVVRRAGLTPWPRIWHNLRASCETDLAGAFPLATVTKWLGNTPSVALRHYVDVGDDAFERARAWSPGGRTDSPTDSLPALHRAAPGCTEGNDTGSGNDTTPGGSGGCFLSVQSSAAQCNDGQKFKARVYGSRTHEDVQALSGADGETDSPTDSLAPVLALVAGLSPADRARLVQILTGEAR